MILASLSLLNTNFDLLLQGRIREFGRRILRITMFYLAVSFLAIVVTLFVYTVFFFGPIAGGLLILCMTLMIVLVAILIRCRVLRKRRNQRAGGQFNWLLVAVCLLLLAVGIKTIGKQKETQRLGSLPSPPSFEGKI